MGLFRRGLRLSLPPLDAAIEEHLDAVKKGQAGATGHLVRALASRELWQASDGIPDGINPITGMVSRTVTMQVLRTTLPDGRLAANVSTSPELVLARCPDAVPFCQPGEQVLHEVLNDTALHGLVLNPASRWQALDKEWIAAGLAGRSL